MLREASFLIPSQRGSKHIIFHEQNREAAGRCDLSQKKHLFWNRRLYQQNATPPPPFFCFLKRGSLTVTRFKGALYKRNPNPPPNPTVATPLFASLRLPGCAT